MKLTAPDVFQAMWLSILPFKNEAGEVVPGFSMLRSGTSGNAKRNLAVAAAAFGLKIVGVVNGKSFTWAKVEGNPDEIKARQLDGLPEGEDSPAKKDAKVAVPLPPHAEGEDDGEDAEDDGGECEDGEDDGEN